MRPAYEVEGDDEAGRKDSGVNVAPIHKLRLTGSYLVSVCSHKCQELVEKSVGSNAGRFVCICRHCSLFVAFRSTVRYEITSGSNKRKKNQSIF